MTATPRDREPWDLSGASDEALLAALRDAYCRAQRRGRAAFAAADAGRSYRRRQRLVDLGHQLDGLAPARPAVIEAQARESHRLRQALGDFDHLTVLADFAQSRRELGPEAADALRRRKPLERRARKNVERAFAERTSALARRLAACLAHSRGKRA